MTVTNKALGFDIIGPVMSGALIASGGTTSTGFNVPISIAAMTLVIPTALDATTTLKLQVLDALNPDGNPTWRDAYYWDPGAAAGAQVKQLITAADPVNRVIVFGGGVLPGGFMRIVASTAQAADRQIEVYFHQTQR